MRIIMATGNAHKAHEIAEMLGGKVKVLTLREVEFEGVIKEDGKSFEENARIKVDALADFVRTRNLTCSGQPFLLLADDSGLEVDALNGEPGVRSARYAGESATDNANTAKLLKALEGVPGFRRTARFRCVLALRNMDLKSDGSFFKGVCEGKIGFAPKGTHGFGYDPIFFPDGFCRTFAELESDEKNRISHRAQAMEQLRLNLAAGGCRI